MSNIPMTKEEKRNRMIFSIVGIILTIVVVGIGIHYFIGLKDKPASWKSNIKVPENISVSYVGDSINGAEIIFTNDPNRKDSDSIRLFEDPSCSYCAKLAGDISDDIADKVDNGAELHVNLMSFLDNKTGLNFSKDNIAALVTLAENGEAEAAWKYYNAMWDNQSEAKNNPDRNYFSEIALSFGASSEVAEKINTVSMETIEHIDKTNQKLMEDKVGSVSTPVLFINDEMNNDPANVDSWGI